MEFSVSDHYELMALHRVIMEAKFAEDPNDPCIQGSPLVSAIADRVVESLIEMDINKYGEDSHLRWQEWRKVDLERREYKIIKTKLQSKDSLKNLDSDGYSEYVKCLFSPLQISDELIDQLLISAKIAQSKNSL